MIRLAIGRVLFWFIEPIVEEARQEEATKNFAFEARLFPHTDEVTRRKFFNLPARVVPNE
jgi:hypothetical protein